MGIPKIDFSGLNSSDPSTEKWTTVRPQVMHALSNAGCFEAVFPPCPPLYGDTVKELFALPLERKKRNYYGPEYPFHGYLGGLPGLDGFETLAIRDAPRPEALHSGIKATKKRKGNERVSTLNLFNTVCDVVHPVAKHLYELERIVRRMILESLGVAKYYESQNESMWYLFRFSEYPPPSKEEKEKKIDKKLGYYSHQDTNTLSIIKQIQTDGLELKTRDGDWIEATPSPDSFIVMAGNSFRAWTNGNVHAPFHRILVGGEVTRYSSILFSVPSENDLVEAPEELVDENHPPLFIPFSYNEFTRFCASEKGAKADDMLEAFCADSKA
ncbi:putative 2-oxoglutarate-dependent dioxygenase AOP1.2-like protein [Carex littledalei]|uniref:Putative 2-oxoglutarate-dependent dioxygenase AOP1.2-like protein n=1 Tax=Carex littledalei TaxID=544730 RepID=A0A833RR87_9POAL|nr:putative 2-oxoglutarate-dependent dioxygenase AOP1.2-like protein [Carex littledalei]